MGCVVNKKVLAKERQHEEQNTVTMPSYHSMDNYMYSYNTHNTMSIISSQQPSNNNKQQPRYIIVITPPQIQQLQLQQSHTQRQRTMTYNNHTLNNNNNNNNNSQIKDKIDVLISNDPMNFK